MDVEPSERADRPPPPFEVDLAPAGRALGCLLRLVLLAFLALVGLFVGMFVLGGSLLGSFGFF